MAFEIPVLSRDRVGSDPRQVFSGEIYDPKQITLLLAEVLPRGHAAVRKVLETMVAFRLEVNVIHENVGINACVRSRAWQGAVHQLTRMVSHAVSPSLVSYNTVINSFHSGESTWPRAMCLLQQLQASRFAPKTSTYNALMASVSSGARTGTSGTGTCAARGASCASARAASDWEVAWRLLGEMKLVMIRQDVKTWSSGSSHGSWSLGLREVLGMQRCGLKLDVVNFGMLVRECGDAMKWRIGSNLFSVMQAWSVQPNARVYGAFINSFGASNWQLSVSSLESMARRGILRDKLCFDACSRACKSAGSWTLALQMQDMAQLRTDGVRSPTFLETPDQWQAALITLRAARCAGFQVDIPLLSAAASACEAKWAEAARLLTVSCSASIKSNEGLHNIVLSSAMKRRNWEVAVGTAVAMEQLRLPLDMFGLSGLIGEYDWELSMHFLAYSTLSDMSDVCHNAAISACENMGRNSKGWQLAACLLLSLFCIRLGNIATSISFNAAISASAASRKWQMAMQEFRSMTEMHMNQDDVSFNALISSLEKTGKWELALALLRRMGQLHLPPDEFSYNAAINVCKYGVRRASATRLRPAQN
ncbi:unnamed protein product [Durusdinium trenchii]|uniref:Chloroplastic (Protein PLASTID TRANSCRIPTIONALLY ACTIVE 2) n=2 Tax=Durusdinium trenchii TaxID=1381693 RepID=A0ABP0M2M7_9DINO